MSWRWPWWHMLWLHSRHMAWGRRLVWAVALVLGLCGQVWVQSLEAPPRGTTLTVLFRAGVGEADIAAFLQGLQGLHGLQGLAPPASATWRGPEELKAAAAGLLKRLGQAEVADWPEAAAWPEAPPAATGWAVELQWPWVGAVQREAATEHLHASAQVEAAHWSEPPPPPPTWHGGLTRLLYALALGGLLLALALGCLGAERRPLQALAALGASHRQLQGLWLFSALAFAAPLSPLAYVCAQALGLCGGAPPPYALPGLPGFMAYGLLYGGGSMLLAHVLRGRTCLA